MKESYKQHFLQAGRIAKEVRAFGKSLIQTGASYNNIIAQILAKIAELGAVPAFPPQMALNEVAAHYLPQPQEDVILSDQIVKLDVGICFQGAIGDCAVTVDLSGTHQQLIDAAEAALKHAEEIIRVGLPIREIGKIIEETITARGFQPVRNLCGHGLGFYKVHTAPLIPNYHDHSKGIIQPGMTFAIEPFATTGKGLIHEQGEATIFSLLKNKPASSPQAQELLETIQGFKGLPFSLHEVVQGQEEARRALAQLVSSGIVGGYPPLVEISGGWVAQAENSVLVDEKGVVTITTR
jgi:methionyl aminopeptidase